MGAEWGGWWLVWRTLPQGWKESQVMDDKAITTKEAHALLCALQAFSPPLTNARLDAMLDNQVLYHAWLREGCKNQGVNNMLKSIFDVTLRQNIALSLQ